MSGTDEAQPGSTWTPPQTPSTPRTPTKSPQDDSHVDSNSVGKTTAVALVDRYALGNTTILSLGHNDEDPRVLLGELEGKTDRTPLNTETVIRNLDENTPRIPMNLIDRDHKDPRTTSSPTTSTPGTTPIGSGSSELKESELQNSEESAIEISGIMVEEKKKEDIDDDVVLKMINTSLYGYSEDENESQEADDTLWETTYDDTTLQESGARSCVAQRTRSHRDMRKLNLTQLMAAWSTSMDDSFVVIGSNAIDSLDLPRPEKAEGDWENKEEWCGKLRLLDTSLDKASRIGGPQRQVEMIKIFNRKTAEIAKKNEEMRQKKGGEADNLDKEGEVKRVTFVVEEPAYTTAIKEVVKALETLVGMNLYTAPLRNVENIIKIILSICMDYSTQVQIIQETMESMAKLIRELLVLRGRMVNLEVENAKLVVEKEAAVNKAQDLTRFNEALNSFSKSMVGGSKDRDVVTEIVGCKVQISGLIEAARIREEKYAKVYERKDTYKTQVGELGRKIIRLENSIIKEKEREYSETQVREAQMNELTSKYEYADERVHNLEDKMERLRLTHQAELAAKVEEQAVKSEEDNGRRVEAETRVLDLEEELRKVRKDLYSKLRSKDAEIIEKDAKIKEGKGTLAEEEKVSNGRRDIIEALRQELELTKMGLEAFRFHCKLFWHEDPTTVFDPRNPERRSKPGPKPKNSEEKDEGMGSEINTTYEASYADLHSSTAGVWGDTSSMDITCGQSNITIETQTSKQKGEKRKRVEIKGAKKIEKGDEVERSEVSSEESSSSYVSGDDKEPSKKKKHSKNKSDKKKATQKDRSKLMNDLKIEHQKQLEEQQKRNQEDMDNMKRELEQKSYHEMENLKKDLNARGIKQLEPKPEEVTRGDVEAAGGVQDPQISSQKTSDNTAQKSALETGNPDPQKSGNQIQMPVAHVDPPNQNREEGSPLIVAVTEENRDKVSNQFRGLIINNDGTITMTPQFYTWSNNSDIQLQKLFKVAPVFPAEVNSVGHPRATRQNIVWTHDGEWILVPVSRLDKGPDFKETLVARIERSIDIDGNIKKALSYGDDETKLKVWFDLEEMKDAFPHWKIPNPSNFYNGKKFSAGLRKPKEAGKPRNQSTKDIKGNKGNYQGPRYKGYNGSQYKGKPETYQEWDKQQYNGNGAQRGNHEQMVWNQYQQHHQHQQHQQHQCQHQIPPPPALLPTPNNQQHQYQHQTPAVIPTPPNQQQYQHPMTTPLPAHNQHQYHHTVPTSTPRPNTQHQYQHPVPTPTQVTAPNDQHQYQHHYQHTTSTEGGTRPKEYQSWDQSWDQHKDVPQQSHSRTPRDYPRERQTPRERYQKDSRERGDDRRNPNQEDEYRGPQEGYQTKEFEDRRREESHDRRSRDASKHRYRETSKERQGDRRQRGRSISTRRRSDRSPSPSSSGIGRGGGHRERDQGAWYDDGRGRGGHDRRGNDASYGGS